MDAAKAGQWMDEAPLVSEVDFSQWPMRISTEGYHDRSYQERELENLWLRVWQIAGRADELPAPGDWKVHNIYDQSFVLVRGKDGQIRGFVNACRHRGNRLCQGKGQAQRFTCRYHNWSYALDGSLLALARPDFDGTIEEFAGNRDELRLIPISAECFGGFIFINPDADAAPLAEFLGPAKAALEAYRMEEWVCVDVNVRETLDCNWKVVMDAFGEGYHVQGVHPEMVGYSDMRRERFMTFGQHCAATVPFGEAPDPDGDAEKDMRAILSVPTEQYPLYAELLPRFAREMESYRGADGKLKLPAGVTARSLFQRQVRAQFMSQGYDVSLLTDTQMTDYQYWLLFPNVFIQICAGDATLIVTDPHPDGDLGRSVWHVMFLHWLPPEARAAKATPPQTMPEGEHFPYHFVLDQDYVQMPIQQQGLRNRLYREMILTKCEPRLAHFHAALDSWLG